MRDNLSGAIWRLTIFLTVCLLGIFGLFAVFAQIRFTDAKTYAAEFNNVTGLEVGDFVRVAGVEVGKVDSIKIRTDNVVVVDFSADDTVMLTKGSRAAIRYADLIGGRYLALEEGAGSVELLNPGDTIPLTQTAPALDLDALIGGFRPLFRALDPEQVNQLSSQLISALQGQGSAIGSFLAHTATLTATLADRDQLIGEVITNLDIVLGSLAEQDKQLAKTVESLSSLVGGLAERGTDISTAIAHTNAATGTLADFLVEARPPLLDTVHQTNRVTSIIAADHEYVDNLVNTLPEAYQILGRQGLYGDFFSFYLCDAILKVTGRGGKPVFIKVAGQDTGRCAPK